jgi:hypothetical protein
MGLFFPQLYLYCGYLSFARFRRKLAESMGWKRYVGATMFGTDSASELTKFQHDPIFAFMLHSDCEGFLSAEDCAKAAPRLRELMQDWSDDEMMGDASCKQWGAELADGMEELAKEGEPLEFR